jgi:hypothetical protein
MTSAVIVVFFVLVVGVLIVPFFFFFVVGFVEAEFVILFVIDWRKVEFHGVNRYDLEFNATLGARDNFSHVLEFLIDNGFAFRTVTHDLPPIKTFLETGTIQRS